MLCSGDGLPEYLKANAGEINRNLLLGLNL